VKKLLAETEYTNNAKVQDIRDAARQLEDLWIDGCFLADEVGLGKTLQGLLAITLSILIYDLTDKDSNVLYRPTLPVVLPTLVNQWLEEIHNYWPGLQIVISYEDHEFKDIYALATIPHIAMKEFPDRSELPTSVEYVFNQHDPRAKWAIVVTSYETQGENREEENQNRAGCTLQDAPVRCSRESSMEEETKKG
jgi:SNF2 family DNA or RNA helicase